MQEGKILTRRLISMEEGTSFPRLSQWVTSLTRPCAFEQRECIRKAREGTKTVKSQHSRLLWTNSTKHRPKDWRLQTKQRAMIFRLKEDSGRREGNIEWPEMSLTTNHNS